MASNSSKTPPSLWKCKTYVDWLKLIKVKRRFIDLHESRQGSALVLPLEDKAMDTITEIDHEDLAKQNDVDAMTEHLNRLFKIKSTITKYQTLDTFQALNFSQTIY